MTRVSMTRRLGSTGPTVFPLALGCMGMSGVYGNSEDDEGIATIHAALELGIGATAYGVLSRGLLSGSAPSGSGDFRSSLPRFRGENLARNQRLVDQLRKIASEKRMTPSQLAIAWVLAKGSSIVPVIGARKRTQLTEAFGALQFELSEDDIARLEEAIPSAAVGGTRYDEHQMKMLDSERGKGS